MIVEIPHLDAIPELVEHVERLTAAVLGTVSMPEEPKYWYTLEDAFRARGGASWTTFKNDPLEHPRLGIADGHQHGRRVWSWETIERWVRVSDETREQYFDELVREGDPAVVARLVQLRKKETCRYREYIESIPALPDTNIA